VANYTPEPTDQAAMPKPWPPQPVSAVDVVDPVNAIATNGLVVPGQISISIDDPGGPLTTWGSNSGFYVLGPKYGFPGVSDSDPSQVFATLCVKDIPAPNAPNNQAYQAPFQQYRNSMVYEPGLLTQAAPNNDPGQFAQNTKHTLFLRRLCCPGLPPNPTPDDPAYNPNLPVNPYVTVDYVENVPVNDGVQLDSNGVHAAMVPKQNRFSMGRNQPYAADRSQQVPQKPVTALMNQPQHTFFGVNVQNVTPANMPPAQQQETPDPNNAGKGLRWPYDWLTFIDRPLISPIELLQVSAFKPHELTQQFMTGGTDPNTGMPLAKFAHRAPWFDNNARIFRLFEYLSATSPMQWVPVGGRCTGAININTLWDPEVFRALGGRTDANFYTDADVDAFFQAMINARSPNGVPVDGDLPFRGLGTGDIESTILRSDPTDANPVPALRRRMFEPLALDPNANGHPYIKYEFLKKVFNNITTRSNVFAVWVTVGFFEVLDDSNPNVPPVLGQEIGRSQNQQKRHRMFALVDRTAATIAFNRLPGAPTPIVGRAGSRPFFVPSLSPVPPGLPPGTAFTVDVPAISGDYEYKSWSINKGDLIVVDTGINQEVVSVIDARVLQPGVDPPSNQGPYIIMAQFSKPHTNRFAISKAMLGNPGPQPRFDFRHPDFQGVVRYVEIVE
jgi:hypothetical protein